MRHAATFPIFAVLLFAVLVGCDRRRGTEGRPSSSSVAQSRDRGLFVAGFDVPADADLGDYQLLETWVERDPASGEQQLVVRLKGPHVDQEPRVRIRGLEDVQYRRIWSERDGPPYEVWLAPNPLPDVLKFHRGDKEVEVRRSGG
jgi:hypothetical protein